MGKTVRKSSGTRRKAKNAIAQVEDRAATRAKAKVKGFLEAVRMLHLRNAQGLTSLLSQVDQSSSYLFENFAMQVDWNPAHAEGLEQPSDAAEYFVPIRVFDYESLDEFLDIETRRLPLKLHRAREDAERRRPRREFETA
jgi:hypothetical protein